MNPIEQRVAQLEKSLKLYRFFFSSVLIAVVAFTLLSTNQKAAIPNIVQAHKFQVVNDKGIVVADLGASVSNTGYLTINNEKAEKVVWLTYTEGGGGYLSLSNKNVEAIKLSTTAEGGRIGIYNRSNNRIGFWGVMENLDGNLSNYDNTGKITGSLP